MKDKINIAELLKDCPKGMELDCTICNNVVTLEAVDTEEYFPIRVVSKAGFHHALTREGCVYEEGDAKCVIFPKGKTTWEGFVPPCKFKYGDIIFSQYYDLKYIAIVKTIDKSNIIYVHCLYGYNCDVFSTDEILGRLDESLETRLATEEEKAKLFQAIKNNGYKWNPETKTLEKLIEPKFRVGDSVRHKSHTRERNIVTEIKDTHYILDDELALPFISQDEYELVPNKFDITTLVPFESRVLVRNVDGDLWKPAIYGFSHSKGCYVVGGVYWRQCIPYEANKELLGTTNNLEEYGSR